MASRRSIIVLGALLLALCLAVHPVASDDSESHTGSPSLRDSQSAPGGAGGQEPAAGTASQGGEGGGEESERTKTKQASAPPPPTPAPAAPQQPKVKKTATKDDSSAKKTKKASSTSSQQKKTSPMAHSAEFSAAAAVEQALEKALGGLRVAMGGAKRCLDLAGVACGEAMKMLGPWNSELRKRYTDSKAWTSKIIEGRTVRSVASVLLMLDLLFVFVSIQSQLDSMRERNIDYAMERMSEFESPIHNAMRVPVSLWHKLPFVASPEPAPPKVTHLEKSEFFKVEEIFSMKASITILATLLTEKLAHVWSQDKYWHEAKLSEKLDVFVLTASIVFEMIFSRMEHDGSLKAIKGSVLRWVVENWRFVRIIHGSYETLTHSPLVAPLVKGS